MGKTLYLECNPGISGDMTVGALLDLGAGGQVLESALESLGVDGCRLHFGRKVVCSLDTSDFDVHLEADGYGRSHARTHRREDTYERVDGYEHSEVHEHCRRHRRERGHKHEDGHSHSHTHRNLHDIYHIIDHLDSNERVKEMARTMFRIVAEAESKAHGLPVEQVHFHEVGAIDSIVDTINVAVCMNNLGVEDVMVSALSEGHGHVRCQRGVLPVPVPATANIASSYGLKLHLTDNDGEMVTPTGAAIAAVLRTKDRLPASCRLLKVGMEAGGRVFKQANVFRAVLLENSQDEDHTVWVLETNLDDCAGETLGLAMEMPLSAGAADVWYTPIHMEKNRPTYMTSVLCHESSIEAMEEVVLTQTTTIGIRHYPTEKTVFEWSEIQVETSYGPTNVKTCAYKDKKFFYPEYENIRRVYIEQGADFQTAYHQVRRKAEESRQD